jgi:hypothetical protein
MSAHLIKRAGRSTCLTRGRYGAGGGGWEPLVIGLARVIVHRRHVAEHVTETRIAHALILPSDER